MKTGQGDQQNPDAGQACQPAEATPLRWSCGLTTTPHPLHLAAAVLASDTPRAPCRQQFCAAADGCGNALHIHGPPREGDRK